MRQVIEWKSPARFDYVLEISTWVSRIGTTSFVLATEMRRAGEPDVLVTTETTYVHVDPKTFTKRAIEPAHARRAGGRRPRQDHGPRRLPAVIVIAELVPAIQPSSAGCLAVGGVSAADVCVARTGSRARLRPG